jgi:hypothetical protein
MLTLNLDAVSPQRMSLVQVFPAFEPVAHAKRDAEDTRAA